MKVVDKDKFKTLSAKMMAIIIIVAVVVVVRNLRGLKRDRTKHGTKVAGS
jgi:hypothetical protein